MLEGKVAPGKGPPRAAERGYKVWRGWETMNGPKVVVCGTCEAHSARNGWKNHIVEDLEGHRPSETSTGLERGNDLPESSWLQ